MASFPANCNTSFMIESKKNRHRDSNISCMIFVKKFMYMYTVYVVHQVISTLTYKSLKIQSFLMHVFLDQKILIKFVLSYRIELAAECILQADKIIFFYGSNSTHDGNVTKTDKLRWQAPVIKKEKVCLHLLWPH